MAPPPALKIKIQLFCGDEIAMGPGKADLLEAIQAHGSISAAGRAMGMSYRRAWLLVDTMNRCWAEAIVVTTPGSAQGGARVTAAGEAVLGHYRALQDRLGQASDSPDHRALRDAILPAPRIGKTG